MYKRQIVISSVTYNKKYLMYGSVIMVTVIAAAIKPAQIVPPCSIPVSYTHLDVYKRQVYGTGNLVKQESGQDGGNHRLAQLGGGYKGGRKVFQAPAEDTVSQNRGKDGQQQSYNDGAGAVAGQGMALQGSDNDQCDGAGCCLLYTSRCV